MGPENKRTILTLHSPGGNGDSRGLKPVFQPFSDNYRVVFFDLRRCGRSEETDFPSFAQLSDDTEELRRKLSLGSVILAGGSGGGFLALEYAIRYPENLSALLLWGAGPIATNWGHIRKHMRETRRKVDWSQLERYWMGQCKGDDDLRQALLEISPLYSGKHRSNPIMPEARDSRTHWHFRTHTYAMREQVDWSVKSRLREIKVYTLIMHGDKNWVVPLSHARMLRDGIPNSELKVFNGCGHSPQLEEKSRSEKLVRGFLSAHGL